MNECQKRLFITHDYKVMIMIFFTFLESKNFEGKNSRKKERKKEKEKEGERKREGKIHF